MSISKKLLFEDYDNFSTEEDYTTSAEAQDYFRNMDEMVTALIDIGLWQPSTQYTKGAVVKSPSMPSGTEAICVAENGGTSSNVEPSWGEVGGDNVSDGTCFWQLRYTGTVTEKMVGYPQRSTAYALNAIVACPYQPGLLLKCTQAGMTTMAALDTASVAVGEVLEDGTVKWEVIVLPIELGGTGAATLEQARINLGIKNDTPIGTIIAYGASNVPSGYLSCNGAAISRTTYADLFEVIGTAYGNGDGSTTFNVPYMNNGSFLEGSNTLGHHKKAGLPNVTGTYIGVRVDGANEDNGAGALYEVSSRNVLYGGGAAELAVETIGFDASRSNSIYGNSDTVQPKSVTVKFCIKYQ